MKSLLLTLAWIFVIGWACLAFSSCAVEETETTVTDAKRGLVTTTKRKSKKPVEGVLPFAGELLKAYSPRRIEDAPRSPVIPAK